MSEPSLSTSIILLHVFVFKNLISYQWLWKSTSTRMWSPFGSDPSRSQANSSLGPLGKSVTLINWISTDGQTCQLTPLAMPNIFVCRHLYLAIEPSISNFSWYMLCLGGLFALAIAYPLSTLVILLSYFLEQ